MHILKTTATVELHIYVLLFFENTVSPKNEIIINFILIYISVTLVIN